MWPFSKKQTIATSNVLSGGVDYHSHILPGVDDGIGTLEEALHTLELYARNGIKELWLTPHVMEDYPNERASLQKHFSRLQETYKGEIILHLASEYMIDNCFEDLLENGELLPIGKSGNHLLVETSYFTPPMRLKETLQRIKSRGYHPLLAHPERYMYMDSDYYRELHDMGVKFQLNILSLAGGYGRAVQKNANWLLRNDLYSVAGSDLHCSDALDIIKGIPLDRATTERLQKLLSNRL